MARYVIEVDGSRYLVEAKMSDGSHRVYRLNTRLLKANEIVEGPIDPLPDAERVFIERQLRSPKQE